MVGVSRPEAKYLLGVLGCVSAERRAIYVSTPLTTGKRRAEWSTELSAGRDLSEAEYARVLRAEVVEPNRDIAVRFVEQLRRQTTRLVIDPSALPDIPGWTQPDYRAFWAGVIETLAETVVFLDGWQFSHGCAYEYLVAVRTGLETLTQRMTPLRLPAAMAQLREAVEDLKDRQMPADFLVGIIAEMTALADQNSGQTDGR